MKWALLLLGLCACDEPAAVVAPAPASQAAPSSTIAPASPPTQSVAEKRARFDARVSVPLPDLLPKNWRTALASLTPKVVSAQVMRSTRVDKAPLGVELQLVFRLFGRDAALDEQVRSALKPWSATKLEIDRVKGVEPRQSQYTVRFARQAAQPPELKDCKAPPAIALPKEAPRWLDRLTNARSTRRRIAVDVVQTAEATRVHLFMLYRNGYALDEAKRHFQRFAKAAGYRPEGADDGIWRDARGREVRWVRTDDDFELGCRIAGPILRFSWVALRD